MFSFLVSVGYTQKLKSTLTSVGSSSIRLNSADETFLIQQSIGQMGIIGTVKKGNNVVQQGFLTNVIYIENHLEASEQDIDLSAYPNPVVDILTISFSRKPSRPVVINVFDLTGRLVLSKTFSENENITLRTSQLAEGIYILRINDGINKWLKKIVKKYQ